VFLVAAWLAIGVGAAMAGTPAPLVEKRGGVEIDWAEGTLTVEAGAAADLHMPGAAEARLGAVRRAVAAARARLKRALAELPLGGARTLSVAAVERALARARTSSVDYQSNGGALARVTVRFSDWLEGAPEVPPAAVAVLTAPAMHLSAAPLAKLGPREVMLGAAVYRLGAPPREANALPAKVDRAGRIAVDADPDLTQKLARGLTLIYVQKVLK
jgi:hypothetical protein